MSNKPKDRGSRRFTRQRSGSGQPLSPTSNLSQVPRWSLSPYEAEPEVHTRTPGMQEAATTSRVIESWLLEGKKDLERRKKGVKIVLLGKFVFDFRCG